MRIACLAPLIAPVLPAGPYGPHAFLVDLARSLAGRGHEVVVYCAEGSRAPGLELRRIRVDPLVAGSRVLPPAGAAMASVRGAEAPAGGSEAVAAAVRAAFEGAVDAIRRDGADVVSQHAFDAEAIELAEDLPVLHTLHLPPIEPSVVAAARTTRAALATVSERCRRDWEGAGVAVPRVLRDGVPDSHPGRPAVEPVALMAGRFSPEKGTAAGIRVALRAGLLPRLVGEPYDQAYFRGEVAPLLGLVDFIPTVARPELWRLMARATVTLLPIAWEEPFGLVAAEAQMAGCPVVGYRRGALPEIVEEGVSGLLVEPDDEDALVAAMEIARRLDRGRVRASARRRLGLETAVAAYERALTEVGRGTGEGFP